MNIFIFISIIGIVYGQSIPIDQSTINKIKRSGITLKKAKEIIESQKNNPNTQLDDTELDNIDTDVSKKESQIDRKKLKEELNSAYKLDMDNVKMPDNEESLSINNSEDEEDDDIKKQILPSTSRSDGYFGYEVFKGNPELFQASIADAIDPEYLIAPGDEIILMLWGEIELNEVFIIEKDGYLFIPNIGQVFVNGLTLSKLEKKLFRLLKRVHSSLDPKTGTASTFLDVSLGSLVLRPLRVFVLGEVNQPGSYSVKSSTSLFTSLYYFNGPSIKGSLRDIKLLRKGKKITNIDFYDYLLSGSQVNDTRLQRDDVIFINKRGKTIKVSGEIHRSAIFELKEDEGLKQLIIMAGGIKPTTYIKRAQIKRIVPYEERLVKGINRTIIDIELSTFLQKNENYTLYDGDEITFFKISDELRNIVTINGSVVRPGQYALGDGLYISELVEKADGILGNTFLDRVDIVRTNSDYSESQIDIDLQKALNNDDEHNILLKSNDVVTVYSLSSMLYKTNVSITGHVKSPGDKPFRQGMEVYDLIFMGGGFENEQHLNNTYFERAELVRLNDDRFTKKIISFRLDSVLAGKGIAKMELKMGDNITVYSLTEVEGGKSPTVTINGHVKKSGTYPLYEENMTLNDLLFIAGGFDDEEHLKTAYLDRAELVRYIKDRSISGKKKKRIIPFRVDSVLSGKGISGMLLEPDDEIRIYSLEQVKGNKGNSVEIEGHIKRPGTYRLAEKNMTLNDLLFMAGGFDDELHLGLTFLDRADLIRDNEDQISQTIIPFNLREVLNNQDSGLNVKLFPGDKIRIYSTKMFNLLHSVSINGIISKPGTYSLKTNMTLKDLILESGGVTADIYRYRVEVARIDPNNIDESKFAEIITVDLNNDYTVFKMGSQKDLKIDSPSNTIEFYLKPYDLITIRPDPYFSKQNKVTIAGFVYYPGEYILRGPNELVTDIIIRAGGLRPEAYPIASELTRGGKKVSLSFEKIIKKPRSKYNFELVAGDIINIGSRPNLVLLLGEINTPGNYQYMAGKRLDNYIKMAGGFTKDAARFATFIEYPNGTSEKLGLLKISPIVLDGSIITVGRKEEVEPFNFTEYLSNLTEFWADLSQAWLMIILALRA